METVTGQPMNEAQSLMAGLYKNGGVETKQKWDDLEVFFTSLMDAIVMANNETIAMLRIPGILSFIADKKATK